MIKIGVEGAMNVMKYLKMFDETPSVSNDSVLIKKSKWIRAPHAGLFESLIKNGTYIRKKKLIGRISDPYGEFERKILSPADCYVFGMNTSPTINKGDALFHVSTLVE